MRLVSVGVHGYKRFAERTAMNVGGRVVAIVGPNEAGKTSLLNAMRRLSSGSSFEDAEWTRDQPKPKGDVIWARFLLDEEDREAVGRVPGIERLKWYVLYRPASGVLSHRVEPRDALSRDLGPRRGSRQPVERAARHRVLREGEDPEREVLVAEQLAALADVLRSDQDTLEDEQLDAIAAAAAALEALELPQDAPKYLRELSARLHRLEEHERSPHPHAQALEALDSRHPTFLLFGARERDLRSEYDLAETADDTPVALDNLVSLAGLDLSALRVARDAGDYARAEKLLEDANHELRTRFEAAWKQSGVFLRLATDGTALRIFVSSVGGYTDIAERSDGLLAFVALLTFTALHGSGRPVILLIDEAENHLHYDAQADLIRVFSQQRAAVKVIYTTHSAGCLPHDLATVRLVAAHDDGTSTIKNAYWADGPGLAPLLVGMGASVLAFTPARRALFAEGGADALLLPTLLREAVGLDDLPFQVVPGLAEVKPADVPGLDLDAAAVAYHVDGDKSGGRVRRKLKKAGVPDLRIISLGGAGSGLVVEDLVDADLYLEAVNAVTRRSNPEAPLMPKAALGQRDRPGRVRAWCADEGLPEPNKAAVAYEVLELRDQGQLVVDSRRMKVLIELYSRCRSLLRLAENGGSG